MSSPPLTDHGPLETMAQLSHEWFDWLLKLALDEAVAKHGDAGRMVAWTVRERFIEGLPRGSFTYHGTDAFRPIDTKEGE